MRCTALTREHTVHCMSTLAQYTHSIRSAHSIAVCVHACLHFYLLVAYCVLDQACTACRLGHGAPQHLLSCGSTQRVRQQQARAVVATVCQFSAMLP
jgi:hypothetical protein